MQINEIHNEFKLLSIAETAKILDVSKATVNYLFESRQLKYVSLKKAKRTTLKFIMEIETIEKPKPKPQRAYLVKDMNQFYKNLTKKG